MPGMVTSHRECRKYSLCLGLYYWTTSVIYSIQQKREIPLAAPFMFQQKCRHAASFCLLLAEVPTQWASWTKERRVSHGPTMKWVHESVSSGAKALWEKRMQIHCQPTPNTSLWSCLFPKFVVTWPWVHESIVYFHRTKSFDAMWVCRYIANRQLFECLWCLCVSEIGGWLAYLVK